MKSYASPPQDLAFFASLTDGEGTGELELVINSFDSNETIFSLQRKIVLEHRLAIANAFGNLPPLVFPHSGVFGFLLFVDGELTTIRHIRAKVK